MRKIFIEADSDGDLRGVAPRRQRMTPVRLAALLVAAAMAATFVLPGRHPHVPARAGPGAGMRVGLVFDVGGRGDKSFNDAAYDGLLRAERELGVTAEVLEPASSEDREAAHAPLRRARLRPRDRRRLHLLERHRPRRA